MISKIIICCVLILAIPISAFSIQQNKIDPVYYSAEQWIKMDFTNLKKSDGKKPNKIELYLLRQSQRKVQKMINQGKLSPDYHLSSQKRDQKKASFYGSWALTGLVTSICLFALNLFLPFAILLGLTSILLALIGLKKDSKKTLARIVSIVSIGLLLFLIVSIATFSLS